MTDRERLLKILDNYPNVSLETVLNLFFEDYGDTVSASRVNWMISNLNNYLDYKINKLEHVQHVSYERASYLKTYLNGDMWATEEAARANLQPQIDNAQAIIDACKSN